MKGMNAFKSASTHSFDCICFICLEWWLSVGPEPDSPVDKAFGPFGGTPWAAYGAIYGQTADEAKQEYLDHGAGTEIDVPLSEDGAVVQGALDRILALEPEHDERPRVPGMDPDPFPMARVEAFYERARAQAEEEEYVASIGRILGKAPECDVEPDDFFGLT